MEYRQLRYFVAAADLGNIGLAASRLNVSQPPVSRQIQALEQELGVELLVRTARGVTLTEAGRVFRAEAGRILERTEMARDRTRRAHEGRLGRLDVAVFGTAIYSVVPRALRRLRDAHPDVGVQLLPMPKGEQIEAVLTGRVHIAFGRYFTPMAGLTIRPLMGEALFAALPEESAPPPGTPIDMAGLAARPQILFPSGDRPGFADAVLAAFGRMGHAPKVESLARDVTSALALVAAGLGAALVPEAVAALQFPGVTFTRPVDCPIDAPLACVHLEEGRPPVLDRFLSTLDALPGESMRDRYRDARE